MHTHMYTLACISVSLSVGFECSVHLFSSCVFACMCVCVCVCVSVWWGVSLCMVLSFRVVAIVLQGRIVLLDAASLEQRTVIKSQFQAVSQSHCLHWGGCVSVCVSVCVCVCVWCVCRWRRLSWVMEQPNSSGKEVDSFCRIKGTDFPYICALGLEDCKGGTYSREGDCKREEEFIELVVLVGCYSANDKWLRILHWERVGCAMAGCVCESKNGIILVLLYTFSNWYYKKKTSVHVNGLGHCVEELWKCTWTEKPFHDR